MQASVIRKLTVAVYALLLVAWIVINSDRSWAEASPFYSLFSHSPVELFSDAIWIIAFIGGVFGLFAAKRWGGFKSVFGKAVSFLSLGLLSQALGQIIYIFYDYVLNNPNPYPSFADIFFFGTIPLYIMGLYYLSSALGIRFSKMGVGSKLIALTIPLILLSITYFGLLSGYHACVQDTSSMENICNEGLVVFLDFAYPLGGAIYVSMATLILVLSRKGLGGVMRSRLSILLVGLLVQFAAEFHYLYVTNTDSFVLGGINDGLYMTAYFIIALSVINIGAVVDRLLSKANVDQPKPSTESEDE